jgi:hypothetical protein
MNLPSLQSIFTIVCIYSVLAPILIGARNYKYLNQSLRVFWYWLIFNFLYLISTSFLYKTPIFHYLEYINSSVSFIFFYTFMRLNWKSETWKKITLGLLIVVLVVILLDVIINFETIEQRKYYSSTFQTIIWIFIGFYYLQRLLKRTDIKSFQALPMFWIGIGNFIIPIIVLSFYLITNSAIRISSDFYFIFSNIGYFSMLIYNILLFIGLKTTKNGIREIIKV